MEITQEIAEKVLTTVDAGLCSGVGVPAPGKMCVEAAVCYAMGLPHGDKPTCVSSALRSFKIDLNDANWSSKAARAKGMRRLALIQLGTAGTLDERAFVTQLASMTIRVVVPAALRAAASATLEQKHKDVLEAAAVRCETEGTRTASAAAIDAASAAAIDDASYAASAAASAAAIDALLSKVAEAAVQILIGLGAAGAQWLELTN